MKRSPISRALRRSFFARRAEGAVEGLLTVLGAFVLIGDLNEAEHDVSGRVGTFNRALSNLDRLRVGENLRNVGLERRRQIGREEGLARLFDALEVLALSEGVEGEVGSHHRVFVIGVGDGELSEELGRLLVVAVFVIGAGDVELHLEGVFVLRVAADELRSQQLERLTGIGDFEGREPLDLARA